MPRRNASGQGRVLVLATSPLTRGGITSVVKAHQRGAQWTQYGCRWIATHRDAALPVKVGYLARALVQYLVALPRARLVHIHLSEPGSMLRKLPFFCLARWTGRRTVVHLHAFSTATTLEGRYRSLYRYIFRRADRVVVLSRFWHDALQRAFALGPRVEILYNPCTTELLPASYAPQPQILYAGTVCPRKGYADLLAAFARIAPRHPEWRLVIAGNGETDKARALAHRLGITDRVRLEGWVGGEAKDRLFKQSAVFCLPSYAEGLPMSVLDAWAYGLPVVATPVGGLPDVARDGHNALLVAPGHIDALERALERLITHPELRRAIGDEGRRMARTTFSVGRITAQLGSLYHTLLYH